MDKTIDDCIEFLKRKIINNQNITDVNYYVSIIDYLENIRKE